MGKMMVLEEFHVTALAPSGLSVPEYRQIYRTLRGPFRNRLKEALPKFLIRYRTLKKVHIKLSQ